MTAHLIWITTHNGLSPQKIYDSKGSKPFVDEGIRNRVVAEHSLSANQAIMSLAELAVVFPAPAASEGAR